MLILSQDKKRILNFDNINMIMIRENKIISFDNTYSDTQEGDLIGVYKTEERAKEILKEITNTFSAAALNGTHDEIDLILKAKFMARYEMPEK